MHDAVPLRTILLTGAAGFIGSHTAEALLGAGHRVIGVDDLSTGSRANLDEAVSNARFRFVHEDVLEAGFLGELVATTRPDAIVHLAGLVSVDRAERDPALNFRLNVEATQVVAEAARTSGVPRVVFASSAAVYGNSQDLPLRESGLPGPAGNYGNAKLISELLLRQYSRSYGFTTICNRYFNVFGPRQDPTSPYSGVVSVFTDLLAKDQPVTIFGDGTQTRDFISVHDVARANLLAATAPGVESGSYNICTGNSRSLLDLLKALKEVCPSAPMPRFGDPRPGDIQHSRGAPELAAARLGFTARTDFQNAMHELTQMKTTPACQTA
ncbi:MAG: NAD-dependent epimerase/dehydratase family protein [Akkermansiaceae bacterium]|nr:NAD-dependent epimerase/dehydratase family protein [Akkermansiaceae bacterium]NNM30858.1 NAD-dependent epimerase/dehydratase family protein [Akkermansiaceae bacterium]